MLKIDKELPVKTQKRFDELNKKRQAEMLTPSEHKELLSLIERTVKSDSERIGHMAELARIRGISLIELMKESEILRFAHG